MQSQEEGNLVIARFYPGEDIMAALEEVCRRHDVRTAVIVSALGQIKQFRLGYFDGKGYRQKDYTATHELLSLSGLISRSDSPDEYRFHLHAVVGDEEQKAFGGHLFQGTIEGTGEIVMLKTGIKARRKTDAAGLPGLELE